MQRFTSYLIDGNIIAAFILIPSFWKGYANWFIHELIVWYTLLIIIIIYLRSKTRQWLYG